MTTTVKTASLEVTAGTTPDGVVPAYNDTSGRVETRYPGALQVADLAALTALPSTNMKEGALAYVLTLKDLFLLVSSTDLSADGFLVVASSSGSFFWLRQRIGHEFWRTRTTWYMGTGTTTANDENDGQLATTPIATWAELNRRLAGQYNNDMTINMQAAPGSPDVVSTGGVVEILAVPHRAPNGNLPTILITGPTPVNSFTGTVTSASGASPAANSAPSLQDTGVSSWTPFVGKLVRVLSGAQAGTIAWIAKDVGSNTARVSEWLATSGGYSIAPAGATYEVVSLATGITGFNLPFSTFSTTFSLARPLITFQNLHINQNSGISTAPAVRFHSCAVLASYAPAYGMWQLHGSLFNTGSSLFYIGNNFTFGRDRSTFVFCASVCLLLGTANTMILFNNTTDHVLEACIVQGAGVGVARGVVEMSSVGIFDVTASPGYALQLSTFGTIYSPYFDYGFAGRIYGSGNTVGFTVFPGGKFLSTLNAPTLTGTTEILIASGSLIRPLIAGSAVPAVATLNTWVTLSSNFANHYFDYYYGTSIRVG